jgi:hypothetical protein
MDTLSNPPSTLITPVPYSPSFEVAEEDEAQTVQELIDALMTISDTTFADGHGGLRSVHAKSHGLLSGRLQVLPLAAPWAQGLFARAAEFRVLIRLSTTPGDLLDDIISTPRGLALKVLGVEGECCGGTTQDFLLVNSPAFPVPTAKGFVSRLRLLASTTDKAPGLKRALSAVLRGSEMLMERMGGQSSTLKGLGGHPLTHILGETFFSQVPFLYGPYMGKWCVAPVSPELLALKDAAVVLDGRPDGLRQAVVDHFEHHAGEWELRVQLCTDIERMPIEDATVPWPEALSPFVPVARISVPAQRAWSEALSAAMDDGLSFSPWHGLAAHRPLGSINRARRLAYERSAAARSPRGRCPVMEPGRVPHAAGTSGPEALSKHD